MLTVRATLRVQKRNVLAYVTQAIEASLRGRPHPSLLPHLDESIPLPMAA